MKRITGSRVILTGASSGIGRALAVELARQGAKLVITARRQQELETLAAELRDSFQTEVEVVPGDITEVEVQRRLLKVARESFGGLDLLVNNAGSGATGRVDLMSPEVIRKLMELNYFSVVSLIQQAVPHLKKSAADEKEYAKGRRPMIVNIGSIVGLRGTPHYGAYGAAKAGLGVLTDALRAELAGDGIDVLLVCPGTTSSEFFDHLMENRSSPRFPEHSSVTPEYVAKQIVCAIQSGKYRIIPHAMSRVFSRLSRFFPSFVDWIMKKYV